MDNKTGETNENLQNDSRPSSPGSVVVHQQPKARELLSSILEKSGKAPHGDYRSMDSGGAIEEVRRVRRGRFFLSNYEQRTFGSLRRPIFDHYCHGAVVGQTEQDHARDGVMCYGAHNDFELIPEFLPLHEWPEYERTDTGFKKKGLSYLGLVTSVQREIGYEEGEKK